MVVLGQAQPPATTPKATVNIPESIQESSVEMGSTEFGKQQPNAFYGIEEDQENENISMGELLKRLSDYDGSSPLSQQSDLFMRKIPLRPTEDRVHVEALAQLLSSKKAKNLKRFVLNKNGGSEEGESGSAITSLDAEMFGILVEKGFLKQPFEPTLEVVGITSNNITIESCMFLSKLLFQKGSKLKKLYLYNNHIGPECLKVIFHPVLEGTKKPDVIAPPLTKLVVISNPIGNSGVKVIRQIAEAIPTISDIVLRSVNIEEEGGLDLADFISKNPGQLVHLDLSENTKIGLKAFQALASALEKSRVSMLDLNEIGMDSTEAVDALVKLIKNNKSIRKFDVSDNKIGNAGVKAIATAIGQFVEGTNDFPFLSKIDISNVGLSSEGVRFVVDAVKKNKKITKVYLYRVDFFMEDSELEKELKDLKKIIRSDFVDEEVISENEENTDVSGETEEPEAAEEEEEVDNFTEEDIKNHPLFSSESSATKKDEL